MKRKNMEAAEEDSSGPLKGISREGPAPLCAFFLKILPKGRLPRLTYSNCIEKPLDRADPIKYTHHG